MTHEGRILKILDSFRAVIDLGDDNGVYDNQKFIVYELGEMITDPDTGKELERLEIIKAKVRIIQVQKIISIIEGYRTERYETEINTQLVTYPAIRFREIKDNIVDSENDSNPLNVKIGDELREIS